MKQHIDYNVYSQKDDYGLNQKPYAICNIDLIQRSNLCLIASGSTVW